MSNANEPLGRLVAWTIDDSEFDLKLNQRILTRSGAFAHIEGFHSAQAALEALRDAAEFPHVIFLDVMMPLMNGFDFLSMATEEFGSRFTSRVVIMLTSSMNPADRTRAEGFDAVHGFLSKPLTVDDSHKTASQAADIMNLDHPNETRAMHQ